MIGIILSGHGSFGSGMLDTARLLAGDIEHIAAVDFPPGMPAEELDRHIREEMETLSDCTRFVILTDLPGGTPFRVAVSLSLSVDTVRVLSGTNVPLLLELALSRADVRDFGAWVAEAVDAAKNALIAFDEGAL